MQFTARKISAPELSEGELAEVRAEVTKQRAWALKEGYARKCPKCGDVVWAGGDRRCRCGRIVAAIIVDDSVLARYGL